MNDFPDNTIYDSEARFSSYFYQVKMIIDQKPQTVLSVGSGSRFLKKYFSDSSIEIKELDIRQDAGADYVADISEQIDLNRTFDIVCAFQVLEHIPFIKFTQTLKNLSTLSEKKVIISLPFRTVDFAFALHIPFIHLAFTKRFQRTFEETTLKKQHLWEMGLKHTPKPLIDQKIKEVFTILKEFDNKKNPYHYFYVLEKL